MWCAQRHGQSITFLPDGRVVEIGGEHEDWYDPNFCVYNDVFVHEPEGAIRIYGYPEALFPPADFHTATLVGGYIYIIGSLGYREQRRYGETPVYRLDTATFRLEPWKTTGETAGWIYEHRAKAISASEILILGGSIAVLEGGEERIVPNESVNLLDLKRLHWRRPSG